MFDFICEKVKNWQKGQARLRNAVSNLAFILPASYHVYKHTSNSFLFC